MFHFDVEFVKEKMWKAINVQYMNRVVWPQDLSIDIAHKISLNILKLHENLDFYSSIFTFHFCQVSVVCSASVLRLLLVMHSWATAKVLLKIKCYLFAQMGKLCWQDPNLINPSLKFLKIKLYTTTIIYCEAAAGTRIFNYPNVKRTLRPCTSLFVL